MRNGPSWLTSAVFVVAVLWLPGCASIDQSGNDEAEKAARSRSRSWYADFAAFQEEAMIVLREITLLRNHPGWADMAALIKAFPSVEYLEGRDVAIAKTRDALAVWTGKWQARSEDILNKYVALSRRSQQVEARRLALRDEWSKIHVELVGAAIRNNANAHQLSAVNSIGESNLRLVDSFRLDSLRLLYVVLP